MLDDALLLPALNRLLDTQPTLRARLAKHAGKQAVLRLLPVRFGFVIAEDGHLGRLDTGKPADTEITVTPDLLLGLLASDSSVLNRAKVSGDGVLASDISAALNGFDWALALRPHLGDIAAARTAQAIAAFGQWRQQAHKSLGRSFTEYATYEAGMLVDGLAVRAFVADVDETRDAAARLEARLKLLEEKRAH